MVNVKVPIVPVEVPSLAEQSRELYAGYWVAEQINSNFDSYQ